MEVKDVLVIVLVLAACVAVCFGAYRWAEHMRRDANAYCAERHATAVAGIGRDFVCVQEVK